ncbi:pyridoxal phosphate-dependent aminotransferase [Marinococcus halophilus]|uniref:Diaminopimelate aminotransferase n=1 Tax=Marinococcus halophilus TaxID=1371 RepID=A0A510Y9J7_MARHA|nr:pyridoxal phosphate-dependent aminotransferase [Marinococcus halophilus]GEK60018.1 diaminopimelate aminotransferase [Marinococcus halophilus]
MRFEPSEQIDRLPEQFFASLSRKVQELKEEGRDLINLGQGNPDRPTPGPIVEKMQKAAENPEYHKYSPFRGYAFLKEAAADFYQREYGVTLDPKTEVAVLFGAKTGLVEISQCLLNPGDTALLPDPGYPDYLSGTALAGAETVFMPLKEENEFRPDFREIEADVLTRAKMMFLNYPNNPTAGIATADFFEETVQTAVQHHICVVHDFAYGSLGYDGEKPPSFLQTPGAREVGVEMYTLSKTFNMAGWRAAVAVGNASVIEMINKMQDHLYVSLFGAVQETAAYAFDHGAGMAEDILNVYESRRNVFIQALRAQGAEVQAPRGSFFVWMKVPNGYTSASFTEKLLEKAGVVVAPGHGFGSMGEGYVRIGLLEEEERLKEAAVRIAGVAAEGK